MHGLKYVLRNINLLNLMLIVSVILLANDIILPMFNMSVKYTLPAVKKIISDKDEKPAEAHVTSPSDYAIIAEENLFHPERKIPVEKKAEQTLPKPEFVLYGTLITDDIRLAYMEDKKSPRSTQGRGTRQTVLKIGDTMSSFTVKEIDVDKVAMVRGEEKIIVPLSDPSQPKARTLIPVPSKGKTQVIQPPSPIKPADRPQRLIKRGQISYHQVQPHRAHPLPLSKIGPFLLLKASSFLMGFTILHAG